LPQDAGRLLCLQRQIGGGGLARLTVSWPALPGPDPKGFFVLAAFKRLVVVLSQALAAALLTLLLVLASLPRGPAGLFGHAESELS
jgi:hypothetical protein